ncbi:MAG: tRNA glutamyl-Q(34) synthetase GluQRS [Betaproteobacteria bacterium CG2_30_59_46]|nr:MAG: tRNA glutamyl-Q(34) synthetase GluQRS [Betaproteobacteria bacterium CG2_30_59_46]PIQ14016.1 MAG: tRNA glutamyl-Q(34) synthetase GluQRS [Hydrogenophilales bacterium CG18_big_fil_WC_8_21_14_2_50_58_12]PIY01976.1 MAG: tRNA glutamyl-Q(34) synthetase GluQRS [Hydrogenophilales bacterium CG_4_10_14_3_um_filter_58_23]PJB08322.1 MAG: tRNA glutamyl-Q(34) synthetase GluQRS [Hydrogenophilales bacterium CG_4_9_14_3_um_filter_59_35]
MISPYRGRFAPSPTGPLHFGSLVAAVGSFLEARSRDGEWLVRMEDLDLPRTVPGAADDILRTLDAFGLHWDGEVMVQSARNEAYRAALAELEKLGAVYPCACTRREIADSALSGIDGPIYPGICRAGLLEGRAPRAMRVRTDSTPVGFDDALQGRISQILATEVGDFVVRRADGLFAYQLAVVVDDAEQAITHVVRGADLLDSTPRQITLQKLLSLPTPAYLHLPIAVNERGEKLSKQTLAPAVSRINPVAQLCEVLAFLNQTPPVELRDVELDGFWKWAVANWRADRLPAQRMMARKGRHQI